MDQDEQLVEFRLIRSMRESRGAVREAMRMLADEGLLTRERRVGTRVARVFRELFDQDVGRSDFTIESIASGERTSGLLDIPIGSPILLVETLLRGRDEVPRLLSYAHLTSNRLALFVSGSAPSA